MSYVSPIGAPAANQKDGATITQTSQLVTAVLPNNGDNIAYSRPTESWEASSPQMGYKIVGEGDRSFRVMDESKGTPIWIRISPTGDVFLAQLNGELPLGNLRSTQTLNELGQSLSSEDFADLMSAIRTGDLSNTTIAKEFSPTTIQSLATVQGEDKLNALSSPSVAPSPYGVGSPPSYPSISSPAAPYPSISSPAAPYPSISGPVAPYPSISGPVAPYPIMSGSATPYPIMSGSATPYSSMNGASVPYPSLPAAYPAGMQMPSYTSPPIASS